MDFGMGIGLDALVGLAGSSWFVIGCCAALGSAALGAALTQMQRARKMCGELRVAARDAAAQKDGVAFSDTFAAYDRMLRLTRFVSAPWVEYTRHLLAQQRRGTRLQATRPASKTISQDPFAQMLGSGNAVPTILFCAGAGASALVLLAEMHPHGYGLAGWREVFHSAGTLVAAPIVFGAAVGFLFAAADKLQRIPLRRCVAAWTEVLDAHIDVVERDRASVLQLRQLERSYEKLEQLGPQVVSGIEDVLERQLTERIGNRLENMLGELTAARVEAGESQLEGVRSLIDELKGSLDRAVSEEMREIAGNLKQVSGSLVGLQSGLEDTMKTVSETVEGSAGVLAERLETSGKRAAECVDRSFGELERSAARLDQAAVSSSIALHSVADLLAQVDRLRGVEANQGQQSGGDPVSHSGRVDARAFARVLRDALEAVPADRLTQDGSVLRYDMRPRVDELEALAEGPSTPETTARREELRKLLRDDFESGLPEDGASTQLVVLPRAEVLELVDLLANC